MTFSPAREFLSRCFSPGETIAILLHSESPIKVAQRIVRLECVQAERYLAWLWHENRSGSNVYVAANPLLDGSRKRTKESIASVRHLYLDIDSDGDERLARLIAADTVPTPNIILNTSPGKYQVLWRVRGFDFDSQEQTLKALALAFGGDPACTDCNRVLRIPGFHNCKYTTPHVVSAEYLADEEYVPDDFGAAVLLVPNWLFNDPASRRAQGKKHSNSEGDWAWVSQQLRLGVDALELTRDLASKRFDKPNPLYYAQRTIDVASARLWLLDGLEIEAVIERLETRRRFEIPAARGLARAREIATTAQRITAQQRASNASPKENHNATA